MKGADQPSRTVSMGFRREMVYSCKKQARQQGGGIPVTVLRALLKRHLFACLWLCSSSAEGCFSV